MAIPEEQLTTWASIGAQTTSKETYATIKSCLDAGTYGGKDFSSFLQGSYGNDTNVWKESDVDVVMELTGTYYYDLSALTPAQQQLYKGNHGAATYAFREFRAEVLAALKAKYGADVEEGTKAISVSANGNRRKADVLACAEHQKILDYGGLAGERKVVGICFYKSDGTQVVNYPRLHSDHLTAKNQATSEWFKHIVRIFKNARQRLVNDGVLEAGVAPSYYIEGLLYNVPNGNFGASYGSSVVKSLSYLAMADRSRFLCANEQYQLLDGNVDVTWNSANCTLFLNAFVNLWNQW